MSIVETKVTEELTIAGITDATTQAEVSQAVVQAASQNWNNATAASDIPYTTFNGDLFSMELFYSENDAMISSDAQYNGNVRGMKWQVAGKSVQSYSFDYDDINRLELGLYKERLQDGSLTTKNKYGVEMAYDAVGNITRLQRRGMSDICYGETLTPSYVFDDIDDLRYTIGYQNRLTNIVEAENQNYGYKGQGGDFQYDGAGNITYDANKDMTIVYNYMNLPSLVTFNQTNSTIKFTYDTAGNKLKKESMGTDSNGSSVNYTQYYIGGIEYKNETIEAINNAEGRLVVIEDDEVRYEYNLTDHLGNVRVTFSDLDDSGRIEASETLGSNEILQENHYYPFGMQMDGPWQQITFEPENRYRFGGKDFNTDFDFDLSDFGARYYDASIARWMNVDPLAESMASWSPYNYSFNSPIAFADPSGLAPTTSVYGGDVSEEKSAARAGRMGIAEAIGTIEQLSANTIPNSGGLQVVTSGVDGEVDKFNQTNSEGMGGFYTTKVESNGKTSIHSTNKEGKMTFEQLSYLMELSNVINSEKTTSISLVTNSEDVFIGRYFTGQIDIGDIRALENQNFASLTGAQSLLHEIVEQASKQRANRLDYNTDHDIGEASERKSNGVIREGSAMRSTTSGRLLIGFGTKKIRNGIQIPMYPVLITKKNNIIGSIK